MNKVTQADRDAAAKYVLIWAGESTQVDYLTQGRSDNSPLVQAFAAHRLETIEECERAIAALPTGQNEGVLEGQEQAYRAVEALKGGNDD